MLHTQPTPSEELEPVQLDDQPEHLAYIRSKLAEHIRGLLIRFLKQNVEVFAWKQEDMGGIDPAVITPPSNLSSRKEELERGATHPTNTLRRAGTSTTRLAGRERGATHPTNTLRRAGTSTTRRPAGTPRLHQIQAS